MSRVYFVNDTSVWHKGSAAVCASLKRRIEAAGHVIAHVCPRPEGPQKRLMKDCDLMIINGEGTFRNEDCNPEDGRIDRLYRGIRLAQDRGMPVYLTNAVWFNMKKRWETVLRQMRGISVREPMSAKYLAQDFYADAEVHPDESYFHPVENKGPGQFQGMDVVGDFYPWNTSEHIDHTDSLVSLMPRLSLHELDWPDLIEQLRGASLYVTGLHHGVYAACKARVRFACCMVRTWKLASLFSWAGVHIPIANSRATLEDGIGFARHNPEVFDTLFDFLENQTPWEIPK